jgi:hypothetical protein
MTNTILTQDQSDALESALVCSCDNKSSIIAWKVENLFSGDEEALNHVELDNLIRALYIGFEIEQPPENCGLDVLGDEVLTGDNILERDGEVILESNALNYLIDFLGAVRKVAGE